MLNQTRNTKAPLLVKEIILPEIEKPGPSHTYLKNASSLLTSDSENGEELTKNDSSGTIIGSHEVKPIRELVGLKKNYDEHYFKGTREKKHSKKKVKHQKVNHSLYELMFKESQDEYEDSKMPRNDSLSLIDIIKRRNFQQQIQNYEKMKEWSKLGSQIKQRQAEETYIQQQENLAETWLEIMKRKNQLRQDCLSSLRPLNKETFYNKRITISIISRKFWNDGKVADESLRQKEEKCESSPEEVINDLGEELLGKLVFVGDESSDESETNSRYKT